MSDHNEPWMLGNGSLCVDPDATTDDLLSDATEWLDCARHLTDYVIHAFQTEGILDCRKMTSILTAAATLTTMGMRCSAHAHGLMNRLD